MADIFSTVQREGQFIWGPLETRARKKGKLAREGRLSYDPGCPPICTQTPAHLPPPSQVAPNPACRSASPSMHLRQPFYTRTEQAAEQIDLGGSSALCPRHSFLLIWLSVILGLSFTPLPSAAISMLGPTGTSNSSPPSPLCPFSEPATVSNQKSEPHP